MERTRPQVVTTAKKDNVARGLVALAFVVISSLFVLYQQSPPRPVGANAAGNVFSSGRAMESLRIIAQKPHPIGSPEHDAVKNFSHPAVNCVGSSNGSANHDGTGISERAIKYGGSQ